MEELSLEELRGRVQSAKSERASLQADLERMKDAPSKEDILASSMAGSHPLPKSIIELSKQVADAEERGIMYRCSAWTVFEIDLDVGRREREARRQHTGRSNPGKEALGLGVRLETFHDGRFYEPYYLVFAKNSQLRSNLALVSEGALDIRAEEARLAQIRPAAQSAPELIDGEEYVRLIRHTVPHFVPLQALLIEHLGWGSGVETRRRGGLDLLDGLLNREGLYAFLGQLHAHLQAFVGRREQTIALRKLPLPSRTSGLEAYSNDRFDHISIVWEVPDVKPQHVDRYEQEMGVGRGSDQDSTTVNLKILPDRRRILAQRRKEKGRQKLVEAVQLVVHIRDPLTDHVGHALQRQSAGEKADVGLQCTHGNVKVELLRNLGSEPRFAKRKRGSDDAEFDKLEYTRRIDLERAFAEPEVSIDRAVRHAVEVIWREEVRAASEYERGFRERGRRQSRHSERASRTPGSSNSEDEDDDP